MLVVRDTSPIRALQALHLVSLVEQMFTRVYIPPAVVHELSVAAPIIGPFNVSEYPCFITQAPKDRSRVAELLIELNTGEAEALALALELQADTVLIDESLGRRVAVRLGLKTTGVLALLVRAKANGHVPEVAPLLDQLNATINFRISPALRARVLRDAHEID